MSLEKITKQLSSQVQSYPPVELWDPPYCGEMDIEIKSNGDWFYMDSKIDRHRLVKLFASVLKKEQDDYFLVTPVEKVKIKVQQAPYVITSWQWQDKAEAPSMQLTTNLGDIFTLDEHHPIWITQNGDLRVIVRRNLEATIHRNVFYQWVEIAEEGDQHLYLQSAGQKFTIGQY